MKNFQVVDFDGTYETSVRFATVDSVRVVYVRKVNVDTMYFSNPQSFASDSAVFSKYQHLDVDTPIAAKPKARPRAKKK